MSLIKMQAENILHPEDKIKKQKQTKEIRSVTQIKLNGIKKIWAELLGQLGGMVQC